MLMVRTFSTLLKIVKRAISSSASSDSLTRPSCFVLGVFLVGRGLVTVCVMGHSDSVFLFFQSFKCTKESL